MSSRILFILLATLLFLSSFTTATVKNISKRQASSNYTITPSFDTKIELAKKM